MKKRILVLSSSTPRSLQIARKIQAALDYDFDSTIWTQDVFKASRSIYESFTKAVESHDYGVFVLVPEDELSKGGDTLSVARMNVVFELGYFAGRHGLDHAFYLTPRGAKLEYLSDLAGMQPLEFDLARFERGEEAAALGSAATAIADSVRADRVKYPAISHHRPNILAGELADLSVGEDYSLAADLKAGHHVHVQVSGTFIAGDDGAFGWGTPMVPTRIGWDNVRGIKDGKQIYFASGSCDAFAAFTVNACCLELRFDIYESQYKAGAPLGTPIRSIVLAVTSTP